MSAFLKKIIGNKEFQDQLADVAALEWQLSPAGEELSVNSKSRHNTQIVWVNSAVLEEEMNHLGPAVLA